MRRALLLLGLLMVAAAPPTAAARDRRVARDSHITAMYALNGTILYARASGRRVGWVRIVDGVRSRARRVPNGAGGGTVGIDTAGHVVVTLRTVRHDRTRWWSYDVVRDRSRPLSVPRGSGCTVEEAAIWRARTAYLRSCGGTRGEALVRLRGRTRVVARGVFADFVAMRGASLVSGIYSDEGSFLQPLVDRGRRCPNSRVELPPVDHGWHALFGVWIGAHGAEWVMGTDASALGAGPYTDLAVMAVHLTGRCSAMTTRWHIPTRPFPTVSAVAIDGRELYYATHTGLYRRRLTNRESAAPPANDDLEQAIAMTGDLPLSARGVVGHATLQPGEPAQTGIERTVWYSWRPSISERVAIGLTGFTDHFVGVFTGGPGVASLMPVPLAEYGCVANAFDVVAGREYWISVGTFGPEPSYEPFELAITRGPLAQC